MSTSPRGKLGGSLLVVVGLALVGAAAAAWFYRPEMYEAFAILRVESRPPAVLERPADGAEQFDLFKRTQVQLILSNAVLSGTLREPSINQLSMVKEHGDDPVSWLKDELLIEYPTDAEILRISLRGSDREELVKIVDQVVAAYIREIVQRDMSMRIDHEQKLKDSYATLSADYEKELNALRTLQTIHKTAGSSAADWQRELAMKELEQLVARRARILEDLRQTNLDIELGKVQAETPKEVKTADDDAQPVPEGQSLTILERKRQVLEQQLAGVDRELENTMRNVADMRHFSAQVAAKEEQIAALRTIKNQVGAEVDRIRVERLSPDRITLVDRATVSPVRQPLEPWMAVTGGAGLLLAALGVAVLAAHNKTDHSN